MGSFAGPIINEINCTALYVARWYVTLVDPHRSSQTRNDLVEIMAHGMSTCLHIKLRS
jgi:hypothetical protein